MFDMTYRIDHNMPFSNRLANLRKQRGLTQEALADIIEITKTQVYRYESGASQPTLEVIKNIAVALSVTADELIFEEGNPTGLKALLALQERCSSQLRLPLVEASSVLQSKIEIASSTLV